MKKFFLRSFLWYQKIPPITANSTRLSRVFNCQIAETESACRVSRHLRELRLWHATQVVFAVRGELSELITAFNCRVLGLFCQSVKNYFNIAHYTYTHLGH